MKLLHTILLYLLSITTLIAQPQLGSWQWAQQMGGYFNTSSGQDEQVTDMCTDKYGNVYTVGHVYEDPKFNQRFFTPPSYNGALNVSYGFLAKYDKCGNFKWVRFINEQETSLEVAVDDSLNVYIDGGGATIFQLDSIHMDTILNTGFFLAKYDSSGNNVWIKAIRAYEGPITYFPHLTVRPNGNLSTIISINSGIFYPGFSYVGTHACNAIFEFDRNGNPVSMIPIDSTNYSNFSLDIDDAIYDNSGNIVMTYGVFDTTRIFDTVIYLPSGSSTHFLLKANPLTKKIIWIREIVQDQYDISGFTYLSIDNRNNIYATGYMGLNSVFNGDTTRFNSTVTFAVDATVKLDSNGNTLWHNIAYSISPTGGGGSYVGRTALSGNQYLCVPINVNGPTYWGGDTLNSIGGVSGTNPWVFTFLNASNGHLVYWDSLPQSNINTTDIFKLIADEQGNVIIGGDFSGGLLNNQIYNVGGINDAFIIKWGLSCSDTEALVPPLAALDLIASDSGHQAIALNWQDMAMYADRYRVYRSTIDSITGFVLIDSVNKYTDHYTDTHVTTNQVYWYRVSAVNNAGETFSNSDSAIIIPAGIAELSDIRHIALYPNPANSYTKLSIWSDANLPFSATITLTDIQGRDSYVKQAEIIQGKNDFIIDLSELSAGVYIVNLHCDNGTYTKRLVVIR